MFDADRLRELMAAREISQSELARRVGVSQATIFKLVSGKLYGSRHLHKIARELGTTPAYLTGETNNPDEGAPPPPEFDFREQQLIAAFRNLREEQRLAVLTIVSGLQAGDRQASAG